MNFPNIVKFPLFSKKPDVAPRPVKSIAVVFNLANHTSLMTAVLYTMARRYIDESISVVMVDIRDRLPRDADQYLWLDAGGPGVFRNYCQANAATLTDPAAERAWCAVLEERSIVITSIETPQYLVEDMAIGQVLKLVSDDPDTQSQFYSLFTKYAIMGQEFMLSQIGIHRYCMYYAALEHAYAFYIGNDVRLKDFTDALDLPEEACGGFDESQKRMAKAMVYKCRDTVIDGHSIQCVSTLGPDIFNILRRIRLTHAPFVHITMGCYGQVVYSDIEFSEKAGFDKAVFLLTPRYEQQVMYK